MTYLSREDILKADDLPTRDVDVPEWGGTVRVRGLSGRDRDAFEASNREVRPGGELVYNPDNLRAKLVARSIVGDDGELLFNELDIGRLGQKSAAALDRVYTVAAELSGMTGDAGKDSEDDQSESPGSTSPTS